MVSEGKVVGRTCKIKLSDKNSALERLFKHLRLFDKNNRQEALALKSIAVSFVSGAYGVMSISDSKKSREEKKV